MWRNSSGGVHSQISTNTPFTMQASSNTKLDSQLPLLKGDYSDPEIHWQQERNKRSKYMSNLDREKMLISDGILPAGWRLPPFVGHHPAIGAFFSAEEEKLLREGDNDTVPFISEEEASRSNSIWSLGGIPAWVLPYQRDALERERRLIDDGVLDAEWRQKGNSLTDPWPMEGQDYFSAEEATLLRNYRVLEEFMKFCPHILTQVKEASVAMLHIREMFAFAKIKDKRRLLKATKLETTYRRISEMTILEYLPVEFEGLRTLAIEHLRVWEGLTEEGKQIFIYAL
jgi:hypothetical protein